MLRLQLISSYLFCSTVLAFAQAAAVPAPAADGRITLDVVVNDKSGTPVAGLQQQDFTLFDNKLPRTIRSFEAAGQSTPADAGCEIVLVIDSVNTAFSRVAYGREQIIKVLRQDGGRLSRPVSIDFFSDAGLDIQPAASLDGNALVTYLNQHETALRSVRRSAGLYGAVERMQISLRAIGQLSEFEAKRPGRKIVIWISPGWPLLSGPNVQLSPKDEQNIFHTIVAASTQLRLARIALYAVDPLGTSDAGGLRTIYYEQFLKGVNAAKKAQFGNLGLQVLANQSGGRVLNSNNDIAAEIERCMRDASAYYILTFDPPPADGPDDYHRVEVKVDKSELKAQTRSGYYAQPIQNRTR